MSEPARNRFALDLDDLERQLRGAAQPPKAGASVDPLVELTRIVGQDDPLKELFAPRDTAAPAQPSPAQRWPQGQQRQEPAFDPAPAPRPAMANDSAPPAEIRGALDEFEALLRRTDGARPAPATEPQSSAVYVPSQEPDDGHPAAYRYEQPEPVQPVPGAARDLDYGQGNEQYEREAQADYAEPPMTVEDDLRDLEPPSSRKGLWTAAALIAVAVIGVAGAMTFRGPSTGSDGQPPVIAADGAPTKVEPVNPGGTEVPNQNKQIYERAGETSTGDTKVVSREEQPVDVQQAARMMAPRVVTPGAATTEGNPLAQAPVAVERSTNAAEPALTPVPAVPGLGEPRKVRTVSIRPDGTPAPPAGANAAYTNGSGPLATGSAPMRITGNAPLNPASTASTNPPPRPRMAAAEPSKVQERVAPPAAETTSTPPVRTANADPAPAASAPRAGRGDYAVQLAAPGSESEARATFAALQRKYANLLGGQSPIVRKTELAGGKTVYRLRVGPYSREDAASMCSQLQSAGGQCFIAKN